MPAKPLLLAPIALTLGLATAAASTTLPPRKAGLWQTTSTMTMVMGGTTHGGQPIITELCSNPQVDAIVQQHMAGGHCGGMSFTGSGGSYTLQGSCPAPGGGGNLVTHGTMTMTGDTASHLDTSTTSPQFSAHMVADSKWVGACPAGMQPRDEGQVQNGAFVKMGNITDSTPAAQ